MHIAKYLDEHISPNDVLRKNKRPYSNSPPNSPRHQRQDAGIC